jgi:opacity protein-like surface antigen
MFVKSNAIRSIACGALLAVSGSLLADQVYYGANVTFLDYSEDGLTDEPSLTALYGRVGTSFNENFSAEARIGFGLTDDTVLVLGNDVDVDLNNFFGAYLKGGAQVTEMFYPYAVIGYTRGEVEASVLGFSVSESESDLSFGLGADFTVSDAMTLNLEYMNYYDKDGVELSGFSVGFISAF